jgi:3-hydroxyacyl-CoA dehydrogenase
MSYRPQRKVSFPSLDAVQGIDDVAERLRRLAAARDRAGQFVWQLLRETLLHAGHRIPEISESILSIDRAMAWGFGWELGPFETWDALEVEQTARRMEQEGRRLPSLIEQVLNSGHRSLYRREAGRRYVFDWSAGKQVELPERPDFIVLASLHDRQQVVARNPSASLVDLGDGVACLEFHSKSNTIGPDIVQLLRESLALCAERFEALVIGNQGKHFSAGANLMALLFEAQDENWEEIDLMVAAFQDAVMAVKLFEKPVVAAPFGMTLGAGCEMSLHASRIRAAAETYIGLPEVGVGLIPAGGGCKEMLLRSLEAIPDDVEVDPLPLFRRVFETIALGKVSTSARDAQRLGYLRPSDRITINHDRLLYDAKQTALAMVAEGYSPARARADIPVLGERGIAAVETHLYNMRAGGFLSDHDTLIARKLAHVLSGGRLPAGTPVTEQYLLDLEREAFLSLCGERKSQERMQHMLKTGKPLRN